MENEKYVGGQDEQATDLRDYFIIIRRRKWIIILALVVVVSSSIAYVQVTKPIWEAKVVVVYEKTNPAAIARLDEINPLAPELDLDVQEVFLISPLVTTEIQERLQERLAEHGVQEFTYEQIGKLLKLSPAKGGKSSAVIEISAQAGMPFYATLLANVGADVLIEKNTQQKREELDRATAFLESQMGRFDRLLEESEKELGNFREKEGIVPTVSKEGTVVGGLLERLGQLQENAIQAEIEVSQTKARLDSVHELIAAKRKNLSPDAQKMGVTFTPQIEILRNRLIQMETDLYAKEQVLTPEHPQVVALKEQVTAVKRQLEGELRKLQVTGETLDPIAEWQALISQEVQLEVSFKGLEQKKRLLDGMVGKFKREHPELASQDLQLLKLERKTRLYEQSYLQLEGKYTEINLLREMKVSDMRVIKQAEEKEARIIKPKKRLTLMMGAVLGLLLGLACAVISEFLDNTVRTEEDVKKLTGLPVVGVIPQFESDGIDENNVIETLPESIRKRRRRYRKQLAALIGRKLTNLPTKDPINEGYRLIRSNLRYAGVKNGNVKTVMLLSSLPGEGKTLTAANLAITLARSGVKTILVDADLHHPRQHLLFGLARSPGLSEFLTDSTKSVIKETDIANLSLITAGELPPNPGDLLTSPKLEILLDALKSMYDIVLFDTPPLGVVSDASALASKMDANLLLVKAGNTKRPLLVQAKDTLGRMGATIFGVIINGLDPRNSSGYYYYYGYGKYRYYHSSQNGEE